MKLGEADLRWLIATPLVVFSVVMGVSLWLVDLASHQSQFAGYLAAELVALSLLLYLERTPRYSEVGKVWILVGCASLVFFLLVGSR